MPPRLRKVEGLRDAGHPSEGRSYVIATGHRLLYSGALEDFRVDEGTYPPSDPSASGSGAASLECDRVQKTESYLFYTLIGLRDCTPVISAAQAIDSTFVLDYVRMCQNPYTGFNPFLEMFRRGYMRVFLDKRSTTLREYLCRCLKGDMRLVESGGEVAIDRFSFSSIPSISPRSVPLAPRFPGDTPANRSLEVASAYGDMLDRLERGRGGLSTLLDSYLVIARDTWGDIAFARSVEAICDAFQRSLVAFHSVVEAGYRLLPTSAWISFARVLGLDGCLAAASASADSPTCDRMADYVIDAYASSLDAPIAISGLRDIEMTFDAGRSGFLAHALQAINQIECFLELADLLDRNTQGNCLNITDANTYLAPWLRCKLESLGETFKGASSELTRSFLASFDLSRVRHGTRVLEELDRFIRESEAARSCDEGDVATWRARVRRAVRDAEKDVATLSVAGSPERIDAVFIAWADFTYTDSARRLFVRLTRECEKDARERDAEFIDQVSRSERRALAVSVRWEHLLACRERLQRYIDGESGGGLQGSTGDATDPGVHDVADDEGVRRYGRRLPLSTLLRTAVLMMAYVAMALVDNAFFDPQGWMGAFLDISHLSLPSGLVVGIKAFALIAFLIVYERVAGRIGMPSIGGVLLQWRSFLVERRLVSLVRDVGGDIGMRRRDADLALGDPVAGTGTARGRRPQGGMSPRGKGIRGAIRSHLIESGLISVASQVGSSIDAAIPAVDGALDFSARTACAPGGSELHAAFPGLGPTAIELISFRRFALAWKPKVPSTPFQWKRTGPLSIMRRAAIGAGHIARREGSPAVAALDTRAELMEHFMEAIIEERYPNARFVSGSAHLDSMPAAGADGLFIVVPLMDRVNYRLGMGHSAISVAHADAKGDIDAAVVFDPDKNECFQAIRGGGSLMNGRRIVAACDPAASGTGGSVLCVDTSGTCSAHAGATAPGTMTYPTGSPALDICYTAAGRFDGYASGPIDAVQVAAALLIAREAGARVGAEDGADPFQAVRESLNPGSADGGGTESIRIVVGNL